MVSYGAPRPRPYQIEGAIREDGRGPSIWDTFCHLPGKIANGDTGDIACDHYHRWPEDVALMRELGLGAYRLSTSWSRILPEGRGEANLKGLEFYDRLIDGILEAGIEPWLCLYHWDLPQALEYRGGWQNRDTAKWYAEYALLTARRLGDRVKHWATFNEPNCACVKGYGDGEHAPGIRGRQSALKAIHVMNLAHGLGIEAMRSARADLLLGNIFNFHPYEPAIDREEDEIATIMFDALMEPLVPGPADAGALSRTARRRDRCSDRAWRSRPHPAKTRLFRFQPLLPRRVRRDPDHPFEVGTLPPPSGARVTDMGWEIAPDAFRSVMIEAKERYSGDLPIYILENGAAFPDRVDPDGRIRDEDRISYLRAYLGAVQDAIAAGVPVRGYFVWSLLDNFEWALGYSKRFGLVHVDYETQQRRPKDSFQFYAELAHGAVLDRD